MNVKGRTRGGTAAVNGAGIVASSNRHSKVNEIRLLRQVGRRHACQVGKPLRGQASCSSHPTKLRSEGLIAHGAKSAELGCLHSIPTTILRNNSLFIKDLRYLNTYSYLGTRTPNASTVFCAHQRGSRKFQTG